MPSDPLLLMEEALRILKEEKESIINLDCLRSYNVLIGDLEKSIVYYRWIVGESIVIRPTSSFTGNYRID